MGELGLEAASEKGLLGWKLERLGDAEPGGVGYEVVVAVGPSLLLRVLGSVYAGRAVVVAAGPALLLRRLLLEPEMK